MENNSDMAPKRNLPRDVFLHLFAVVTLYWSAVSFITLCWQYVNYFFPDPLSYSYGLSGSVRFAVASLVIVFPLFLLSSWLLAKIYAKESQVRDSKIRKWLIYLTLFIAALVIVGDLIFVINTFLGGEITMRFILKALSVLLVAIAIFWYYLDDVRRVTTSQLAKVFAIATAVVILAAVVGAFFIVGSPMRARAEQFDAQRSSDLQGIQGQIVYYYQSKGKLPSSLADLNDSISGYVAPMDPQTKAPYEYSIMDPIKLKFQLCATFNLQLMSDNNDRPIIAPSPAIYSDGVSQNWDHAAGRVCFDRVIDSQLYPPYKK
jgi:hypothetical protein